MRTTFPLTFCTGVNGVREWLVLSGHKSVPGPPFSFTKLFTAAKGKGWNRAFTVSHMCSLCVWQEAHHCLHGRLQHYLLEPLESHFIFFFYRTHSSVFLNFTTYSSKWRTLSTVLSTNQSREFWKHGLRRTGRTFIKMILLLLLLLLLLLWLLLKLVSETIMISETTTMSLPVTANTMTPTNPTNTAGTLLAPLTAPRTATTAALLKPHLTTIIIKAALLRVPHRCLLWIVQLPPLLFPSSPSSHYPYYHSTTTLLVMLRQEAIQFFLLCTR